MTKEETFFPVDLSSDYVHQEFLMHRNYTYHFLGDLKTDEYVVLESVFHHAMEKKDLATKVYLKDLSTMLELPMKDLSPTIQALADHGYLRWTHDDDGKEGTYVILAKKAIELLENNEATVRDVVGTAISEFGEEKTKELIRLMKEFSTLLVGAEQKKKEKQ